MKTTTPITVTRDTAGYLLIQIPEGLSAIPPRSERRFTKAQEASDWLEFYAAGETIHWNLTPKQP